MLWGVYSPTIGLCKPIIGLGQTYCDHMYLRINIFPLSLCSIWTKFHFSLVSSALSVMARGRQPRSQLIGAMYRDSKLKKEKGNMKPAWKAKYPPCTAAAVAGSCPSPCVAATTSVWQLPSITLVTIQPRQDLQSSHTSPQASLIPDLQTAIHPNMHPYVTDILTLNSL